MAGSKTPVTFILAYNWATDEAKWVTKSELFRMEGADLHWCEIYQDEDDGYEIISKLAGKKPEVFIEEVIQPRKDNA